MASSSCSRRYDVFPSFSGEDVRKSFLSHLLKELDRKSIYTFIDHGIERSRPIGPELLSAIRESRISIIVFSKNYASSTWCLNELVEIHKSFKELNQMVIPIFVNVDPSDVRKQTGEFGKVFEETCKGKTDDEKQRWMQVLAEVANMAGEDLRNWCSEANMIEKIADDVSNKLITPSNCYGDFVGIEAHLEAMNSMLCLESEQARTVGIVGPSGIGKSTIGRALFSQLSSQFHYRAFVTYKRTNLDDYGMKLCWEEQFLSEILGQKDLKISHLGVVEQRLKLKKVLIFLDDVDDIELLKTLVGQPGWFGSGSRIIVITQDRQLLKAHEIDLIYEVEFPSEHLALKMLCRSAFGQNSPPHGFMDLAVKVAKLAGNLPLALNVVGSSLRGRDKGEWMEMLPRLQNGLDGKIEKILRVSYDRLEGKEQELFLFIAFAGLVDGLQEDYIRFNYVPISACMKDLLGDSVNTGLKMLADKSLIRITPHETIEMHNLLQKLAREFFLAESKSNTKNRRFLVDIEDIRDVFADKTGTKTILGIYFNTLELEEPFSMDEKSFEGMGNLQFLIVIDYVGPWIQTGNGRLHLPQGLVYLPRKLRLLKWEGYPSKSLPSNFMAECLVELRVENSSLEKLWEGILPLRNLKRMIMSWSIYLKELPDLSNAINLDEVYLDGCTSLVTLHSSVQNLHKLRKLDLEGCTELESLPALLNLKSLGYLNLRGCYRLRNFPRIHIYTTSSHGIGIEVEDCFWNKNLRRPDYLGCLMRCIPCKFLPEHIFGLTVKGNMLEKLWEGVQSLGSLVRMDLSECENMIEIPDLSKATNLERLDLNNRKSLVTVPCTIGNLNNMVTLQMKECTRLDSLPADVNLSSLETLDLRGCSRLKSFPQISLSIKKLKLNETAIEQVPGCIGNFSRLAILKMRGCRRLKNVSPNIFRLRSLEKVDFSDCGEFTALSDAIVVATMPMEDQFPPMPLDTQKRSIMPMVCMPRRKEYFEFNNCFQLDGEARALILRSYFRTTVLPGEEVPTYFRHRASGNSLAVTLPQSCLSQEPFEFKACVVVRKGFHTYLRVRWHFSDIDFWDTIYEDKLDSCKRDHLVLFPFKFRPTDRLCLSPSKFDYKNVEFEFSTVDSDTLSPFRRIKGCGIRVLNLSPTGRPSKSDYDDIESEFSFNQRIRGCGVLVLKGSEFLGDKCDVVGTERSNKRKRMASKSLEEHIRRHGSGHGID